MFNLFNMFTTEDDHNLRYNNYHIINYSEDKWSYDWQRFPGLSYIPYVTEWENKHVAVHPLTQSQEVMKDKWYYCLYITIFYVILIPVLKFWVKNKGQTYQMRGLLTV